MPSGWGEWAVLLGGKGGDHQLQEKEKKKKRMCVFTTGGTQLRTGNLASLGTELSLPSFLACLRHKIRIPFGDVPPRPSDAPCGFFVGHLDLRHFTHI